MTETTWRLPSDDAIAAILAERIDAQKDGVGIVVGVIDADGQRVVSHGEMTKGDGRRPDGDSVFEVGSITKTITSLLLADMVERGEAALDDPAAKFLPAGVSMPERNGRQITLIDLATHTSGLPSMPDNFKPARPEDPFADYTAEKLYACLGSHQLRRDIGEAYEYSNLGAGLLGHLLELRAGVSYGALVAERIAGPLGMDSTSLETAPRMAARLARGHRRDLERIPSWSSDGVLAGMGLLRSTTNDLLRLSAAALGFVETPLAAAMAAQRRPRRPMGSAGRREVGLGWHISQAQGREVYWHSGSAGGYRTYLGLDVEARRGAVVLTNVAGERGGDDIGFHLLTGSPLRPGARLREAIELPPEALARFVGRYQLTPQMILTVTQEGAQLFAQATEQRRAAIFPESDTAFFWKVANAQATFELDAGGKVTGLLFRQSGRELPSPRISDA